MHVNYHIVLPTIVQLLVFPAAVITKQHLPKLKQSVGMYLTVLDIVLASRFQLYPEKWHEKGNNKIYCSAKQVAYGY